MGSFHPIAWYHRFDGGRAFYTELGHTDESYAEPAVSQPPRGRHHLGSDALSHADSASE